MDLWVPDRAARDALGELPEGVSVNLIASDGDLPQAIIDAEFLVPSPENLSVLEMLGGMPKLRVVQTLSAGVDWLVEELPALLPLADIVIVLLPLTPTTTGLLDRKLLGTLREGALLVNAARGLIVDTEALVELLCSGRVRAALDVADPEPLPSDHPLWDAPGVTITPHFAGDTRVAERRAFAFVGEQVGRYVRGEPLANVVSDGY